MRSPLPQGNVSLQSPFPSSHAVLPRRPAVRTGGNRRAAAVVAAITSLFAISAVAVVVKDGATTRPVASPAETAVPAEATAPAKATPPVEASVSVETHTTPAEARVAPARMLQTASLTGEATTPPAAANLDEQLGGAPAQPSAERQQADEPGTETTAAIGRSGQQAVEAVPIAETEAEAVKLDEEMARVSPDFVEPEGKTPADKTSTNKTAAASGQPASSAPATASASAVPAPAVPLAPATTTSWVKMHAGPDNEAATITLVPANAAIMAPAECRHWCVVEYKGQRGYIYKDFVKRPAPQKSEADPAPTASQDVAQASEPAPPVATRVPRGR